jgi:hypothetical protein
MYTDGYDDFGRNIKLRCFRGYSLVYLRRRLIIFGFGVEFSSYPLFILLL